MMQARAWDSLYRTITTFCIFFAFLGRRLYIMRLWNWLRFCVFKDI